MKVEQKTQVLIVGAGPTGIELAVALKKNDIPFLIFDAGQIGHTIAWWPKNTRFFSTSERIAMPGLPLHVFDQQHPTSDQYLAYLREIVQQFALEIHNYEKVTGIKKLEAGFEVFTETQRGKFVYQAEQIVLAMGGMNKPRLLNIPGEELPFVTHYLNDPHDYFQRRLLVVGGRNSAIEYALRCWRAGAQVSLSYRKEEIGKASVKPALKQDFETVVREGKLEFLPSTLPVKITPQAVTIQKTDSQGNPLVGTEEYYPFDAVLICTGYMADTTLFEQLGVTLVGEEQAPVYDENTMETNVSGVFVLGTAAGGSQKKYQHFIETSHKHVPKILKAVEKSKEV